MRIVVVVSEFPKITETFAYRNIIEYDSLGHETWLFHIKPFRANEVVHGFFERKLSQVFSFPYLGFSTVKACLKEWFRAPIKLSKLTLTLIGTHWKEPKRALAVAALFPKSVALGRWCRKNGIEHLHGEFAGHPANASMIAATVAGIPYSFSAHANDIFVSQAMLVEKAQKAEFVRSISDYNVKFLSKLDGFPVDRIRVIRCGVSEDVLGSPALSENAPEKLNILYVGSLLPKKGVQHLLNALALLPKDMNWSARIIGGGDLFEQLQEQTAKLDLEDRVTFDGPQSSEAVAKANQDAHVLVLPSIIAKQGRVEGIPVVLMEAMGHGRAVIASALSGIPELVENGVTGRLVPAGEDAAIASALTDTLSNWEETKRLAKSGQKRIQEHYLISKNAQRLSREMERSTR